MDLRLKLCENDKKKKLNKNCIEFNDFFIILLPKANQHYGTYNILKVPLCMSYIEAGKEIPIYIKLYR